MRKHLVIVLGVLAASSAFAATSALATDTPAPAAPQPAQPAPPISSLPSVLNKCSDSTLPSSSVSARSAKSAVRSRALRGTARDTGCGVAMVTVSVSRVRGKQCQHLSSKRLGRVGRCTGDSWLLATGTRNWRLTLPNRLPRGTYRIRTRAIDFAGNVERVRTHRLKLG
jgi:hypothetical protein